MGETKIVKCPMCETVPQETTDGSAKWVYDSDKELLICKPCYNTYRSKPSVYITQEIEEVNKAVNETLSKGKDSLCLCGHSKAWHHLGLSNNPTACEIINCACMLFNAKPETVEFCQCGHTMLWHKKGVDVRTECEWKEGGACACKLFNVPSLGPDREVCKCNHTRSLHSDTKEDKPCLVASCQCKRFEGMNQFRPFNTITTSSYGDSNYGSLAVSCRHTPTVIFDSDGITFYQASRYYIKGRWQDTAESIILNCCSDSLNNKNDSYFPSAFSVLEEYLDSDYQEIVLGWGDMQAPPVMLDFWQAFVDECKRNKITKVLCTCLGGHGRTGTALAAIFMVTHKVASHVAIKWIREHACKECIESTSQMDYLRQLGAYLQLEVYEPLPVENKDKEVKLTMDWEDEMVETKKKRKKKKGKTKKKERGKYFNGEYSWAYD